jgi:flagellar M-ring protein FliF
MVDTTQNQIMAQTEASGGNSLLKQSSTVISNALKFTAQPGVQRALPVIVASLAIIVGLGVFAFLQQPSRTTLYASLPDADKSRVLEALLNSGVDAAIDGATGEITVPVNDFHKSKISLASQGLPATSPDGYEGLNSIPMGSSKSVELMRLKQSQEIELAKSINEIDTIMSARVHLAIPEKSVFARNQQPPTASVFVQLATGRVLSAQQVQAIIHLVSSSIPNMSKDDVTVIDQNGNLLSKSVDDPDSQLSDSQLQHRMRLESIYRSRIVQILTPMVGPGNVTAQVNLDIDFTRNEITEEIVDPNGTAIRSEQNSKDLSTDVPAKGVPGAVANTPPTQAQLQTNPGSAMNEQQLRRSSSTEVKNYEVSKRISTTLRPSAIITKINASVLLRDGTTIDPDTGLEVPQPISAEAKAEVERLVNDTIGMDPERGDTLTVTSAPFVSTLEGVSKQWHEIPLIKDLAKQVITILILGIIALGVIRPLLSRVLVPIGVGAPGEVITDMAEEIDIDEVEVQEGESLEDIKAKLKPKKQAISAEMLDTANSYDDKVAVMRMIVSDDAGRASNVFKSMMAEDMD